MCDCHAAYTKIKLNYNAGLTAMPRLSLIKGWDVTEDCALVGLALVRLSPGRTILASGEAIPR
jgi:hypothetical protein